MVTACWDPRLVRTGGMMMLTFFYILYLLLKVLNPNSITCRGSGVKVFSPHHRAILWHQTGVVQFNSILTLSTWRQHQIPQVKGSVLQDCAPCSHPHFRQQSQVQIVTFFFSPNWIPFIYFYCLPGISSSVLIRSNESKYPCLVLKLTGRNIHSFTIKYDVNCKSP